MIAPTILYEDTDFFVVNKPAGLLVHKPKEDSREETLADWIVVRDKRIATVGDDPESRPGIVHRLDRETSGVMLVARSSQAFEYLKSLFQDGTIQKTYLALVWGRVTDERGSIDAPLGIKRGSMKRTTWQKSARMVKQAKTEYTRRAIYTFGGEPFTLLEVEPKTGRTHQIRVHMNSIGHPVVGDKLYGGRMRLSSSERLGVPRHFLHASALSFRAPGGMPIKVEAQLPKDLEQVLDQLELESGDPRV